MPSTSVQIASDPVAAAELERYILKKQPNITVKRGAIHRDVAVLDVLIAAAATEGVKLVFGLVKEFVTARMKSGSKKKPGPIAIKVAAHHFTINSVSDLGQLDDFERQLLNGQI